MRTVDEFMGELVSYFGGFRTDGVMHDIANELAYIAPGDLDRLMRQLKLSLPAAYPPDLKAIADAIKAAKIEPLNDPARERVCPSCGGKWYSSGVCPWCCYDPDCGESPEEWRAFVEAHRAGKVERIDVGGILRDLYASKRVLTDEM